MKLGVQIVRFDWPGSPSSIRETLARIARAAEEAGLDSLWVMDHFFQIRGIGRMDDPMLEAYTTLSYLAALTRRIHLGVLVCGVVYRHPAVLIKIATTLDVLAGGRTYFGIGAAWNQQEADGLGIPFPATPVRFELLEDTLRAAHHMWTDDRRPLQATHLHMARPLSVPAPLSKPHPKILVGGDGERKTLRLVARYADACNLFAGDTDRLRRKLGILRQHCDDLGRNYDDIERTSLDSIPSGRSGISAADMIVACRSQAAVGIQHAIVSLPGGREIEAIETLGREVVPAAAQL
jgi:F420-dependent oxidoreductase-like protein